MTTRNYRDNNRELESSRPYHTESTGYSSERLVAAGRALLETIQGDIYSRDLRFPIPDDKAPTPGIILPGPSGPYRRKALASLMEGRR